MQLRIKCYIGLTNIQDCCVIVRTEWRRMLGIEHGIHSEGWRRGIIVRILLFIQWRRHIHQTYVGHEDLPVSNDHLHLHIGFKPGKTAVILEGNCSSMAFDDNAGYFSIE